MVNLKAFVVIGFGLASISNCFADKSITPKDPLQAHEKWSKNEKKVRKFLDDALEKHKAKDEYYQTIRKAILTEMSFENIQRDLLQPFTANVKSKNAKRIQTHLSKNFKFSAMAVFEKSSEQYANIKITNWKKTSANSGSKNLLNYLNSFDQIEDFDIVVNNYEDLNKKTSLNNAILQASLDVRGINKNERRNDKADVLIKISKTKNSWKIDHIKLVKGQTLSSNKPSFQKLAESNLKNMKPYLRKEAIRRGGYALSTTDVNKDGKTDIYIGAYGDTQLLLNQGNNKFVKSDIPGLKTHTLVKSAAFIDFDNDNDQDLLLVRFNPNHHKQNNIIIYRNNKGKFEEVSNFPTDYQSFYAMPSTVADFDNDSYLDFYVGFPGAKDFTVIKDPLMVQGNLIEGLFQNTSSKPDQIAFSNATHKLPKREISETQTLFPHGTVSSDLDLDGDMDLIVVDDRGNLSPVYLNDGNGKFSLVNQKLNVHTEEYGMTVVLGDINNDGLQDMAFSSVNFHAANRMLSLRKKIDDDREFTRPGTQPLQLYLNKKTHFEEVSQKIGLTDTGEGAAGVEFIDYNNDGHLDIYLANGLWSGSESGQDLSSLFMGSVWTDLAHIEHDLIGASGRTIEIAHSVFMNILSHVQGSDKKFVKGKRPRLAGHQRNRLFRNTGNGKFIEVGYLEGVDSIADGYVIAKADMNNDNKMDLVLRNGDPGSLDVKFQPVEVFLNNNDEGNSVKLTFKGKLSNADAVGVTAKAQINGKWIVKHLHGNNGTVQSEKLLHFGLGKHKQIDKLQVFWPSGAKSTLKNLKKGHHHIDESRTMNSKLSLKN